LGTKIHVGVSGLGLPVTLVLTAGQAADVKQAEPWMAGISAEVVIGDKGYDSDELVEAIQAKGAEAVIPPKKNRKVQRGYDADRYQDRNLVERVFSKVKQYRRGNRSRDGGDKRMVPESNGERQERANI
jgi:transposase